MAQKPENRFKNKCLDKLWTIPNSYWEVIQQKSKKGTADVIGFIGRYGVWLEFKVDDGKAEPLQLHKLKVLEKNGTYARIVRPGNFDVVYQELLVLSKLRRD